MLGNSPCILLRSNGGQWNVVECHLCDEYSRWYSRSNGRSFASREDAIEYAIKLADVLSIAKSDIVEHLGERESSAGDRSDVHPLQRLLYQGPAPSNEVAFGQSFDPALRPQA
jgi:hypothetical protein